MTEYKIEQVEATLEVLKNLKAEISAEPTLNLPKYSLDEIVWKMVVYFEITLDTLVQDRDRPATPKEAYERAMSVVL